MTFTVKPNRISYGYDGTQKEILKHFNKSFHRMSKYILNSEYDIVFLNPISNKWKNQLCEDILWESSIDGNPLDTCSRIKKRITFLKSSTYGTYSFIGIFMLDKNYDWKLDTYPTGKMMDPRLKYTRIAEEFTI